MTCSPWHELSWVDDNYCHVLMTGYCYLLIQAVWIVMYRRLWFIVNPCPFCVLHCGTSIPQWGTDVPQWRTYIPHCGIENAHVLWYNYNHISYIIIMPVKIHSQSLWRYIYNAFRLYITPTVLRARVRTRTFYKFSFSSITSITNSVNNCIIR